MHKVILGGAGGPAVTFKTVKSSAGVRVCSTIWAIADFPMEGLYAEQSPAPGKGVE